MKTYKEILEGVTDKEITSSIKTVTDKIRGMKQSIFVGKKYPLSKFKKLLPDNIKGDDINEVGNGVMNNLSYFKLDWKK